MLMSRFGLSMIYSPFPKFKLSKCFLKVSSGKSFTDWGGLSLFTISQKIFWVTWSQVTNLFRNVTFVFVEWRVNFLFVFFACTSWLLKWLVVLKRSILIFKSYIFLSFCLAFCVIPWFVCFFTPPSGLFAVRVTLSQHASVVCGLCEDACYIFCNVVYMFLLYVFFVVYIF